MTADASYTFFGWQARGRAPIQPPTGMPAGRDVRGPRRAAAPHPKRETLGTWGNGRPDAMNSAASASSSAPVSAGASSRGRPTTTTASSSTTSSSTSSTTSSSTTSTTTTTTLPGGYSFDDEFDNTSLDLTKWQPNWLAD